MNLNERMYGLAGVVHDSAARMRQAVENGSWGEAARAQDELQKALNQTAVILPDLDPTGQARAIFDGGQRASSGGVSFAPPARKQR